jgi:hypothetical protein
MDTGLDQLIAAFQIFKKYIRHGNKSHPTCCDHDKLMVMVDPILVSEEDKETLEELGFNPNLEDSNFYSYRFGSC